MDIKRNGRKIIWTDEMFDFIKANYMLYPSRTLASMMGLDKCVVLRFLKNNNLKVPKDLVKVWKYQDRKGSTNFWAYEDQYIRDHYLDLPVKTIAKNMARSSTAVRAALNRMNLVIPEDIKERNIQAGRIQKGTIPPNKGKKLSEYMSAEMIKKIKETSFKKGNKPHNTRYDGALSLRTDVTTGLQYLYIRISEAVWVMLHRHIWTQRNGEIPDGHVIRFKNGNQLDVRIENLELISMTENMNMNSGAVNLTDNMVALYIFPKDKELRKEALKNKDLIILKRQELLLNRKLKSHDKEQTK